MSFPDLDGTYIIHFSWISIDFVWEVLIPLELLRISTVFCMHAGSFIFGRMHIFPQWEDEQCAQS